MQRIIEGVQIRIKETSTSAGNLTLRLVSGLFVGLCLTLIGQELMGYGSIAFWFVIISITLAFLKISRDWKGIGVIIFDLVFILVGLLLRMYILIAPGQ